MRRLINLTQPIRINLTPQSLPRSYPASARAQFAAMNRPRNRQPRPPRGGGGNRDNGRGGRKAAATPQQAAGTVPTISQVIPGATVFIILKEDQASGRETPGVVQELLTNGNHPRGIKVRLRSGQVGRVQRMGSGTGVPVPDENTGVPPVGSNTGPSSRGGRGSRGGGGASNRFTHRYTDIRNDEDYDYTSGPPPRSLADFMPTLSDDATPRSPGPAASEPTVNCPMCDAFEGDEAAVTHHIEQAHLN